MNQHNVNSTISNSGDSSVNWGNENNIRIVNSTVNINNISNRAPKIQRASKAPLNIFDKTVKRSWFNYIGGILSFLGSIASIISLITPDAFLWPIIPFFLGIIFLAVGFRLKRKKYFKLITSILEVDENGTLFRTKIKGKCNECGGSLYLSVIGDKDNAQEYILCSNNDNHRWKFDYTKLDV